VCQKTEDSVSEDRGQKTEDSESEDSVSEDRGQRTVGQRTEDMGIWDALKIVKFSSHALLSRRAGRPEGPRARPSGTKTFENLSQNYQDETDGAEPVSPRP